MTLCKIEGCERGGKMRRGMCHLHYRRWVKAQGGKIERPSHEARFAANVDKGDGAGCWLWTGTRTGERLIYGTITLGGRAWLAHRWSYEHHVGPIPDGLVIDHLCRVPLCVRPDHLEPVDNRTNVIERGTGPFAEKSRQTHCVNGHEFTPENTRIRMDSARGTRTCIPCQRERARRYYRERRVA